MLEPSLSGGAELSFVSVDEAGGACARPAARHPADVSPYLYNKHFHIGIYGKRERESGFFSFWV